MRNTRVIIHRSAFVRNLETIRDLVQNIPLCLAVKANAYGHGAPECARLAKKAGVFALGVSCLAEGIELREAGTEGPILMYGLPAKGDAESISHYGLEPFCATADHLDDLARAARKTGIPVKVHLKVDTGMGRIGCSPVEAASLAARIRQLAPHLVFQGLCTHFPVSDMDSGGFTDRQINTFIHLAEELRSQGTGPAIVHASNTGGILNFPHARFDMVRPGILAWGYPGKDQPGLAASGLADRIQPVMEVRSRVSQVKEVEEGRGISYGLRWKAPGPRWIASLTSGYADGLPRLASSKLRISLPDGSIDWPQVGTICMDQCMVDLGPSRGPDGTGLPSPLAPGDEVVIFGGQAAMDAQDVADLVPTIPYELLCGINQRIPREYQD